MNKSQIDHAVVHGSALTGYKYLNPDVKTTRFSASVDDATGRWRGTFYNGETIVAIVDHEEVVKLSLIGGFLRHPLRFKRELENAN